MRFLFVYQDYVVDARRLVESLSVRDVTVIPVRKGATGPTAEERSLLHNNIGADAALCSVNRKYKGGIKALLALRYESKDFRFEDQILKAWLLPEHVVRELPGKPSAAFEAAAASSPLVIAPYALLDADLLPAHRWDFTTVSAKMLARYANGERDLGALRSWKALYGVDFAANGQVSFQYTITWNGEEVRHTSEWHLKEGDNTTPESAARIYFDRVAFKRGARVVVFRVGPHPRPGKYKVDLSLPDPTG